MLRGNGCLCGGVGERVVERHLVVHLLVSGERGVAGAVRLLVWFDLRMQPVSHPFRERRLVVRVQRLRRLVGVVLAAMLRWAHWFTQHVRQGGTTRRIAHGHRRLPKRCLIVVGLGRGPFCPLAPHQTDPADPAIYYDEAHGNDDVHVGFDAIVAVLS